MDGCIQVDEWNIVDICRLEVEEYINVRYHLSSTVVVCSGVLVSHVVAHDRRVMRLERRSAESETM